jgi:hypothetical protein
MRGRMAQIAAWIDRAAPELMVVDVSVEVTALCRLMGVPVVAVAMQGDRTDRAHQLGYGLAEMLLACWPASVPTHGPSAWNDKTFYAGAFSRFDDRIGTNDHTRADPTRTNRPRQVVLLLGGGGTDIAIDDIRAARAATPHWHWEILGPGHRWQADPWAALCAADVVVTHAGQNALAEVAAARTPAAVIPQRRPHNEQFATAATLDKAELALVRYEWPAPSEWSTVLEKAAERDGRRWALWCPGDGAARAAQFVESTALRMANSTTCVRQ